MIVFTRRKGKEDTVGKRKRSLRERKGTDNVHSGKSLKQLVKERKGTDKDRRKKGFRTKGLVEKNKKDLLN